jgi:hypothetical protein
VWGTKGRNVGYYRRVDRVPGSVQGSWDRAKLQAACRGTRDRAKLWAVFRGHGTGQRALRA